jgi:hypothetical protein
LGYILGDFFKNSSGHPAPNLKFLRLQSTQEDVFAFIGEIRTFSLAEIISAQNIGIMLGN